MTTGLLGTILTLLGFLSYFFLFVRWPATRDVPWVNLPLVATGALLSLAGLRGFSAKGLGRRTADGAAVIVSWGLAGLFCVYVFSFSATMPDGATSPRPGEPAPPLSGVDQRGEQVRLSELKGQRVLLVFYRGHW